MSEEKKPCPKKLEMRVSLLEQLVSTYQLREKADVQIRSLTQSYNELNQNNQEEKKES